LRHRQKKGYDAWAQRLHSPVFHQLDEPVSKQQAPGFRVQRRLRELQISTTTTPSTAGEMEAGRVVGEERGEGAGVGAR